MFLRYFLYCLATALSVSCNSENERSQNLQSNQQVSNLSSDTNNIYPDFNFTQFIKRFSKDRAFQLNRTKFPLRIKQYDIENDKDTIIYKPSSEFEMLDFREKKSDSRHEQWKRNIVLNKNKTKVIVEIRGIDNGIVLDYYFENISGKWILVEVDDSST